MKLTYLCDCGNQVEFFATGVIDDYGREAVEVEDDDRLQISFGETGLSLQCRFCSQVFIIDKP
ncbi:hypothetical protein AB6A23_14705 [Paenibacillus tarimensis]